MRILIINTRHYFGGGDSTYAFNLANLLRSQGHEVAFLAMQDKRNLSDPNEDLFVSHIDFREVNQHKTIRNGLKVLIRSIYSLEARNNFRKLVKRFKPDVVHLQSIDSHITPSIIFEAKNRHIPVVWTLHDYNTVCPNSHLLNDVKQDICQKCHKGNYLNAIVTRCKKGSLLASLMTALRAYSYHVMRVYDHVDAFITPSWFLRGKLLSEGYSLQKVHRISNFLFDIHVNEAFGNSLETDKYFLFFGRMEYIKGIYTLIEAFKNLSKINLVLAGRADSKVHSELLGSLPPNIKYVGMKQGDELVNLIKNSYMTLIPSLWFENQPYSILESFMYSKPVIASNIGGMVELVEHERRGLLIKPGDVQDIINAINYSVSNPALVENMGKNAREYALENHGPDGHYRDLFQLYKSLTNNCNNGSIRA